MRIMSLSNHRIGFSLTELLVVVAIIGLLSVVMLPTIHLIRESARTVVCAGNMRNLGMYSLAYAADRRGFLPPAWHWWDPARRPWNFLTSVDAGPHSWDFGGPWNVWARYVAREQCENEGDVGYQDAWMKSGRHMRHFQCPSAPVQFVGLSDPPPAGWGPKHEYVTSSYGMNTACLGDYRPLYPDASTWIMANPQDDRSAKGSPGWPGYGIGIGTMRDSFRRLGDIPNQSMTILLAEHVGSRVNRFTVITDPPFVQDPIDTAGQPIGGSGSRVAPFDSDWTNPQHALRVSHRGRANFLFHDGRVAALAPWETCGMDWNQPNMWTGR